MRTIAVMMGGIWTPLLALVVAASALSAHAAELPSYFKETSVTIISWTTG
jgi:hypothetical protein